MMNTPYNLIFAYDLKTLRTNRTISIFSRKNVNANNKKQNA